jgi:kinetochore protein Mis13/DSN1
MKLTMDTALPHEEVETADFYKHIEANGLLETKRMQQLLIWCANRSVDQKPMGASFEVSSAIAAARVIQDELVKDLGNKSELSDWFSREEVPVKPTEVPERPNPKNVQNTEKIADLEEQIAK